MTPRFHPYAPLAAALALSAASLLAAWVGIGPASPGVAAIRITAADGLGDAAASPFARTAVDPDDARGAASVAAASPHAAYLTGGGARVWIESSAADAPALLATPALFTTPAPLRAGTASAAAPRPGVSAAGAAGAPGRDASTGRAAGLAS